jgi:hypothetical protein
MTSTLLLYVPDLLEERLALRVIYFTGRFRISYVWNQFPPYLTLLPRFGGMTSCCHSEGHELKASVLTSAWVESALMLGWSRAKSAFVGWELQC